MAVPAQDHCGTGRADQRLDRIRASGNQPSAFDGVEQIGVVVFRAGVKAACPTDRKLEGQAGKPAPRLGIEIAPGVGVGGA